MAEPLGSAVSALTAAIWLPPAAANTGGASPTPPTSIEPAPMACSNGGPEVKSAQCALNGSLLIRPAAVRSACEPDPAWSPMFSVTLDTSTVLADVVPLAAGLAGDVLPAVDPALAVELEPDDEHAAAPDASRPAAIAAAATRRPARPPPGRLPGRLVASFLISFLPCRRPARRAGDFSVRSGTCRCGRAGGPRSPRSCG